MLRGWQGWYSSAPAAGPHPALPAPSWPTNPPSSSATAGCATCVRYLGYNADAAVSYGKHCGATFPHMAWSRFYSPATHSVQSLMAQIRKRPPDELVSVYALAREWMQNEPDAEQQRLPPVQVFPHA